MREEDRERRKGRRDVEKMSEYKTGPEGKRKKAERPVTGGQWPSGTRREWLLL